MAVLTFWIQIALLLKCPNVTTPVDVSLDKIEGGKHHIFKLKSQGAGYQKESID